ncbi:MAG: hypothetical protein Kilf2KO_48400 [Rhodospirillales bacterium]
MTLVAADDLADKDLFEAVQAFVAQHDHPGVGRFRDAMADWGDVHLAVEPHHRPASDTLRDIAAEAPVHDLVARFARHRLSRKWEQSYTKADGVVGDEMLAGYGFAEIVGKWGPFVSERIRSGIGVWGPNILYPLHRHRADEIYIVLAGSAEFTLGEGDSAQVFRRGAGAVVEVVPMTLHGFRTLEEPLAVFYLWQQGDLRELSSFAG